MVEAACEAFPQRLITKSKQVNGVSYSLLLFVVRESYQGDEEAQNFISGLAHMKMKTILEKILCFADLPTDTDLGTMGHPTVPCEEAEILKSELENAIVRFSEGCCSGLLTQRESRRCRATAFIVEQMYNMFVFGSPIPKAKPEEMGKTAGWLRSYYHS